GSPVNGDSSAALGGADDGVGAGDAVSATISQTARASAAAPADALIAITRRRDVMTVSSPEIHFLHQAVPAEQRAGRLSRRGRRAAWRSRGGAARTPGPAAGPGAAGGVRCRRRRR